MRKEGGKQRHEVTKRAAFLLCVCGRSLNKKKIHHVDLACLLVILHLSMVLFWAVSVVFGVWEKKDMDF